MFFLECDQILSKSMHVYYELLKITFKYKANRHDNFCHALLYCYGIHIYLLMAYSCFCLLFKDEYRTLGYIKDFPVQYNSRHKYYTENTVLDC